MMKFIKLLVFMVAWVLSFGCGIVLYSAFVLHIPFTTPDLVVYGCGFLLSMLWMIFNTVKA